MTDPAPGRKGPAKTSQPEYYWVWVTCLLGVDYFSTLAYQPSITFGAAGRLGPLATVVVVLVTLFGALPVYFYVAGKSSRGQGSIALLERLVRGWAGKTLVLFLLGFAATDFVMIKSLSLADAAQHVTHDSYLESQHTLRDLTTDLRAWAAAHAGETVTSYFNEQLIVTILLGLIGFWFWWILRRGFDRNVLVWAVPVVLAYLILNGIVLGAGCWYLWDHPERLQTWWEQIESGNWAMQAPFWAGPNWPSIAILCLLLLPQLSLGLSGFELSLILMPQVRGKPDDQEEHPRSRIRNTRKVLISAALIMSVYLLAAALVTTILIPESALIGSGPANNRALAYLAHGGEMAAHASGGAENLSPLFGPAFGAVYDIVTVLLLTLAGTSVMTALAGLLPTFLLRFGMELGWTARWGVMLAIFALVNLAVTLYFRADVEDQRGAYATGVLVLMSSASIVTALDRREAKRARGKRRSAWYFTLIAVIFSATAAAVIVTAPTGLLIAFGFIVAVLSMSVVIRAVRSDELRTVGYDFASPGAQAMWEELRILDFPVLVPRRPGLRDRDEKEAHIRRDHSLDPNAVIVFLEIEVDDPSNFLQQLMIDVEKEHKRYVIHVSRCVSVAHAISAIAMEMSKESKPPSLHFGWTDMDGLAASWSYFAMGEGNIPLKVRELIHSAEPDPARRPRVIVG
jgi:hypothetical protein